MMQRFCPVARIQVGWPFRKGQVDSMTATQTATAADKAQKPGKDEVILDVDGY